MIAAQGETTQRAVSLQLENLKSEVGRDTATSEISESIAQELSLWEKIVFSFDMDRDQGAGSSGAPGKSNKEATNNSGTGRDSSQRARSSSSGDAQQQPVPQFPQQGFPYGGLDPYTLAQLAAMSALSAHGMQAPAPPDPFLALRQMQALGLIQPGAVGFPGFPPGFPSPQTPGGQDMQQSSGTLSWPPQFPPTPSALPHLQNQNLSPLLFSGMSNTASGGPSHSASHATGVAGPSRISMSPSPTSSRSERSPVDMDEGAIAEDKRRRNTAASGESCMT